MKQGNQEARLHKVRVIASFRNVPVLGITIPQSLKHWQGVMVEIRESGNSLILESGCKPAAFMFNQMKKMCEDMQKVKL